MTSGGPDRLGRFSRELTRAGEKSVSHRAGAVVICGHIGDGSMKSEMKDIDYIVTWNCNQICIDTWIEKRKRPDGDYDLIGMCRRTEYDGNTGVVFDDKTYPTGDKGWAPRYAIEPGRPSLWRRY